MKIRRACSIIRRVLKERPPISIRLFARILIGVTVVLLPFAVLYWLNPLIGDLTIGNDYVNFSIDHQLALQYSLKHGAFPLFVPGFAGGGHSAAALTLGQLYHPISHLASHLPGYWTGDALQVNTVLNLLFIGITHLVVLLLLRRMKLSAVAAFIISFITVYNLRMLDMFRYGASLENYLGFLLLASALAFDYLSPSRIRGAVTVLCTYLLVCGGHPQIMYLGLLGVGFIAAVLPFALGATLPEERPDKRRLRSFYARTTIFIGIGLIMSAPYVLPFYLEFIKGNASRVSRAYSWSLGYSDSWGGTLNSFFRPLNADVHGAFGSSALIGWIFFAPLAALFSKRAPKVVYVLFGMCLTVFLISLGGATPLHYLFWKFVPLFDAFRTPGRINMILPFLFLLLLAWWMKEGITLHFRSTRLSKISPALLFSAVTAAVYLAYNILLIHIVPKPSHYVPMHVNKHSFTIQQIAYGIGLATLVLAAAYWQLSRFRRVSAAVGLLLCLTVVAQCGLQLRWGTWIKSQPQKPTLEETDRNMQRTFAVAGLSGFGMESGPVAEQMEKSALSPHLARFFRTYETFGSNEAAYGFITGNRRADRAAVVSDQPSKTEAICTDSTKPCAPDKIDMTYAAYNRVEFDVRAAEDGLFTLAFPYFPNWRAFVDGAPAPAVRAEGYQVGVFIPKGKHRVTFRFFGTAVRIGLVCFALVLLGLAVYLSYAKRLRTKLLTIIPGALLAAAVVWLPHRSFYISDDLNTRYHWTSKELPNFRNIALFKTASMSSIKSNERPFDYYAGRALDGDKRSASLTKPGRQRPWWQVDLGAMVSVDSVVIHENTGTPLRSVTPLDIQVSSDGKRFHSAKRLTEIPKPKPLRLELNGRKARFIRIQSEDKGTLGFREVEVYSR